MCLLVKDPEARGVGVGKTPQKTPSISHWGAPNSPPGRGHSVVGPQEPAGLGCRSQDQRMAEVGGTLGSPQPHQAPQNVPSPTPGGFGDPPAPGPGARAPAQQHCPGARGSLWSSWRLELPVHLSFSISQMGNDKKHTENLASVFIASRRCHILPGPGPAASSRGLAGLPSPFMPHLFPSAFPFEFSSSAATQQHPIPSHKDVLEGSF